VKLTGYTDSVCVRPGGSLGFHIHCEGDHVDAQLVRLLHGDENPAGPGFQEREIASSVDGRHPAGRQEIFRGSFAELETPTPLLDDDNFEIDLWIWPTRPGLGAQGLLSWCARDHTEPRVARVASLDPRAAAAKSRPFQADGRASGFFPALRGQRRI
jgi:hypothetical protein